MKLVETSKLEGHHRGLETCFSEFNVSCVFDYKADPNMGALLQNSTFTGC